VITSLFLHPLQRYKYLFFGLLFFLFPLGLFAQISPDSPQPPALIDSLLNSPNPTEFGEFLNLHQQLRIVLFLTILGFLPFVLVMMTSFTRISITLHFLRQALATQNTPSAQIIIGLSLILTAFVMHPVITEINDNALTPYFNNELANDPEVRLGIKGEDTLLIERTWKPLRAFLLNHTRERDLQLFLDMGNVELPSLPTDYYGNPAADASGPAYDLAFIPWYCLVPAFVISELRVAFMMGFLLFVPFLVIDMVIASILMSMGMMMLPPVMISLPFKLLLFIVIDGWRLIIQQIVTGFNPLG